MQAYMRIYSPYENVSRQEPALKTNHVDFN